MRFDLLDEFSTLVPFGYVSKQNRVVQYPTPAIEAVRPGPIAKSVSRFKFLFKFVTALGQIRRHEEHRKIG